MSAYWVVIIHLTNVVMITTINAEQQCAPVQQQKLNTKSVLAVFLICACYVFHKNVTKWTKSLKRETNWCLSSQSPVFCLHPAHPDLCRLLSYINHHCCFCHLY